MVSMSGFGATGPESQYAGYGGSLECLSGVQGLTAYSRDGEPLRVREVDITNGLMGACAAMTALCHRQHTGEGQWIDLSELETSAWLIGDHLMEADVNKRQTLPLGNRHPLFAPQGCYRCKGDDRWLVLTIRSDEEWKKFCACAGHPDWASDPRFAGVAARRTNHDAVDELINAWTKEQDADAAMMALQGTGLAAGRVANARDLAADPHLLARDWLQVSPDTVPGKKYPGFPFRFKRGGGTIRRHGPALGEDNRKVLCDELGLPASALPPLGKENIRTAFELT
jgi:crotonobetainyl-CoA:carnitine CoA-transferase CaiB-like acyl-CoA transferase